MGVFYFGLIARINFAFRFSALELCRETTAQIAAGIHPIKVICRIRHNKAVGSLPLNRKDKHGKNIAINVILDKFLIICL